MEEKKQPITPIPPLESAFEIQQAIEAILYAAGYPVRFDKLSEVSAHLETFFNGDPDSRHASARSFNDRDKTLERTTVGEEIVDNEHLIVRAQKFLGNDDLVFRFVGKRFHFRHEQIGVEIDTLGFFREHDGHAEKPRRRASDRNTRSFYGEDFVDSFALETTEKFLAHLIEQFHIKAVIQKRVHFQNVARADHAFFTNFFF